ncbi:MAG: radical SAM protein [Candidatus Glassbacteria bacterium]|nr:radical SAM protein [Candidatus Glassbacteria bacterium]
MQCTTRSFPELISSFLKGKIAELEGSCGPESRQYKSIARQFFYNPAEKESERSHWRLRHYDADMKTGEDTEALLGVERLYRRTMLLELTTFCFSHCRWCLRSNYQRFTLRKEQIVNNIALAGSREARDTVREILITGGDPLINTQILDFALDEIARSAPNIEIIRIGTRAFSHHPKQVDNELVQMFAKHQRNFRLEIGTQINSPVEFWPESVDAMHRIQDLGITIYTQNVLLKGVNDDLETLVELYDECRRHAIEAHYLFHCVPMRGMEHHRTSVAKGLALISRLTAGGYISGRSKPTFTVMTDIGKITLYEGSILQRREKTQEAQLQSSYSLKERQAYNPGFQLPDSAEVDEQGYLTVWYPDGKDDNFWGD